MSEVLLGAVLGAVISGANSLIITAINYHVDHKKQIEKLKQKQIKIKRKKLNNLYYDLINIINMYPNQSPNDVLKNVDYAPNYSLESFDAINTILDYQIEDYKECKAKQTYKEQKYELDLNIRNREYAKKEIIQIRNAYFQANDAYNRFKKSNKTDFDLYAGQEVKESLMTFEVVIHNIFISGRRAENSDVSAHNNIDFARKKIVDSIKEDIGIMI